MKHFAVKLTIIFAMIGLVAFAPDYYLLPGSFYLHKGSKLNVHLLAGDNINKGEESAYSTAETMGFNVYEGSKKTDLTKLTKDNATPVAALDMENNGLVLVEMNTKELTDVPREDFLTYLQDQGFDDIADQLKNSNKLNF